MRTALLAAFALCVAGAPTPANAVCNLLVDPKGDAKPVQEDGLDLLGADIASNARDVTVAFRLAASPAGLAPTAPTGRAFLAEFAGSKATRRVYVRYIETPNATEAIYGYYETVIRTHEWIGPAKARVKGNILFVTAPVLGLSGYGKFTPGSRLSGLRVRAGRYSGIYADGDHYGHNIHWADDTTKGRTYVAGSPSCVRVGGPA